MTLFSSRLDVDVTRARLFRALLMTEVDEVDDRRRFRRRAFQRGLLEDVVLEAGRAARPDCSAIGASMPPRVSKPSAGGLRVRSP